MESTSQLNIKDNLRYILNQIPKEVTLVAVSKTKPISHITEAYSTGQRDFGENKVQELVEKHASLPEDIRWHLIGHLQTNKVKHIASFVHLIHAVDSEKLLKEINKQAKKHQRKIDVLIQIKIAKEDTKFGMDRKTAEELFTRNLSEEYPDVNVVGLMGMATNTEDEDSIKSEFDFLKEFFNNSNSSSTINKPKLSTLSMGMTSDYLLAVSCGSNLIRVGSAIFGERNYNLT